MRISKAELGKQFEKARHRGWLSFFYDAAHASGEDVAVVMAIASRETNIEQIIGDAGHGFGVMQLDIRSFPDFIRSGKWKDAHAVIMKGAEVLAGKRQQLTANAKKQMSIIDSKGRHYTFRMPVITGDVLTKTAIAMYNVGLFAPYHLSKGRDPDYSTTDGDYATDVLTRAVEFRRLLEAANRLDEPVAETAIEAAPVAVEGETPIETLKPQEAGVALPEGFLQATVGSAKRLWAALAAAGLTVGQGLFDWAKGHMELVFLVVGIALVYILVQTYLDRKRMHHAANPGENNVH